MPSSEAAHRRRARFLVATLAWVITVVGATAVGLTAVGAIGNGIIGSGQRPLTPQEVQARLLAAAARPGAVEGVAARAPASPAPDALASRGGTVLAHCRGGVVEVVSVTPAQGFRVRDQDEDDRDKVELDSDEVDVELRLSCAAGRPVARESIDD